MARMANQAPRRLAVPRYHSPLRFSLPNSPPNRLPILAEAIIHSIPNDAYIPSVVFRAPLGEELFDICFCAKYGNASSYSVANLVARTLPRNTLLMISAVLTTVLLPAQQVVNIKVDVSKKIGSFQQVWAWVGHDEPNYTYSEEGRSLLTKLSQLSPYPVHDRTHNLLTSGDGTPALKWGSTNAFTRDASGRPVYNWTIIDKIFDTYKATGIRPLVEIGFMPEALSTHPEPYEHHWPQDFATGWAYPPKNYDEWSELIYRWVRHMVDRYGAAEVAEWEWEVWNEPDIFVLARNR